MRKIPKLEKIPTFFGMVIFWEGCLWQWFRPPVLVKPLSRSQCLPAWSYVFLTVISWIMCKTFHRLISLSFKRKSIINNYLLFKAFFLSWWERLAKLFKMWKFAIWWRDDTTSYMDNQLLVKVNLLAQTEPCDYLADTKTENISRCNVKLQNNKTPRSHKRPDDSACCIKKNVSPPKSG